MSTTGLSPDCITHYNPQPERDTRDRWHVDLYRLRRWADLAAFAVDNPGREAVDTLLLLSEELEDALERAIEEQVAA